MNVNNNCYIVTIEQIICAKKFQYLQAPRCSCSHFRNERNLGKRLRSSTANYVSLCISTTLMYVC